MAIEQKIVTIRQALETLKDGLAIFSEYKQEALNNPTKRSKQNFLMARDSVIQRFEYCTDLFWKVLKSYMEDIQKITLTEYSPKGMIRTAVSARIITEQEGKQCMDMITNRNQTSYIYHQELAEKIASKVPEFYQLIKNVIDRIAVS